MKCAEPASRYCSSARCVDSDLIIPLNDNPFPSSKARNVSTSGRQSDGFDLSSKSDKWVEIYEARSEFDQYDQTGIFDESDVAAMVRCGVSFIRLDFIDSLNKAPLTFWRGNPPDGRREAMAWSWAANDMGANGNLALFRGSDGRWISKP